MPSPHQLGIGRQVDHDVASVGAEQSCRSARASGPGGRLAFRSQGRAVVKAASTAVSSAARCSGKRCTIPDPAGAGRDARRARRRPPWTSSVCVPAGDGPRAPIRTAPGAPNSGCPGTPPWRCRPPCARRRWWPGRAPRATPSAARCRPTLPPSCVRRGTPAPSGVTGRGQEAVERDLGDSGSLARGCATTAPSRNAPRTRPIPCGCPAVGRQGSTMAP